NSGLSLRCIKDPRDVHQKKSCRQQDCRIEHRAAEEEDDEIHPDRARKERQRNAAVLPVQHYSAVAD
ncbi:hypothetical protein H4R24_005651, partial [Coemansia sp. RSA 988]